MTRLRTMEYDQSPIIVGGVGGSGTGAVAAILNALDVNIGHDLNWPRDNLAFTLLFKHPRMYRYPRALEQPLAEFKLDCLRRHILGRAPTTRQKYHVVHMALEMIRRGREAAGLGRVSWAIQRARNLSSQQVVRNSARWGWKEPNSFLFLKQLDMHFPQMKYVHVLRHGLDMAFSGNQAQFENWAHVFDVEAQAPTNRNAYSRGSLDYWIRANRFAVSTAEQLLGDRFFLLNFDEMCLDPESIVPRLIEFLSMKPDASKLDQVLGIPHVPKSMHRYVSRGFEHFDADQLSAVREFGFKIAS